MDIQAHISEAYNRPVLKCDQIGLIGTPFENLLHPEILAVYRFAGNAGLAVYRSYGLQTIQKMIF